MSACTNFALRAGPLGMDPKSRAATLGGKPLDLSFTEFALLYHMAAGHGLPFGAGELYQAVWGGDRVAKNVENTVCAHIRRIRRKLGPHRELVETRYGIGYVFTARAVPVEPEPEARFLVGTAELAGAVAAIARVLRGRLAGTAGEEETLTGLRADGDVRWLLGVGGEVS